MSYVLLFCVIIVLALMIVAWVARSEGKKMDAKAQEAGAIAMISAQHIEGLGLTNKADCDIYLFTDKLLIDSNGRKFEIPASRIRATEYKSEQELREKGKSVVGRAIIGTLLVPGLGTIVGGMSGIGNKKVKGRHNYYLIVNYEDVNGELNGVTFLNNLNALRLGNFCTKVNTHLQTVQQVTTL